MQNIYGAMGYTLLEKNGKYVLIFSDKHSNLKKCDDNMQSKGIDELLGNKKTTSTVLLEEVNHDDFKLKELWGESEHTQKLKKLYLKNPKEIIPIDIRPYLSLFSWEVLFDDKIPKKDEMSNKSLGDYLKKLHDFVNSDIKINGSESEKHLGEIKKEFNAFYNGLDKKQTIGKIINDEENIKNLGIYNTFMDCIMEWFMVSLINKSKRNVIVHAGMAHTEEVLNLLEKKYGYKIVSKWGINNLDKIDNIDNINDGCIKIPYQVLSRFNKYLKYN